MATPAHMALPINSCNEYKHNKIWKGPDQMICKFCTKSCNL